MRDLEDIIEEIKEYKARPNFRGESPTLYKERKEGKFRTVMGVRVCDFCFFADEKWVLPHNQKGLSFSGSWYNLQFAYKKYKNWQ